MTATCPPSDDDVETKRCTRLTPAVLTCSLISPRPAVPVLPFDTLCRLLLRENNLQLHDFGILTRIAAPAADTETGMETAVRTAFMARNASL